MINKMPDYLITRHKLYAPGSAFIGLFFLLLSLPGFATAGPDDYEASLPREETSAVDDESHLPKQWWGQPASNRVYLGMWSHHCPPEDHQDWNHQLLAACYNGYYGGTFINTHSDRAWSLGWQRAWFQGQYADLHWELGYRLGMMYGYKNYLRLFDTPFFPLLQVMADIDFKRVGIELTWAGVVFTAGFSYCF